MKKNRVVFIVLVLLCVPFLLQAQNAQSLSGVKGICEQFLEKIQKGDYNGAFSYIRSKPHSIGEQQFSELEVTTIQQSSTIQNLYGRAFRYILVNEKNISDVALRLEYLMVRENIPIRWKFIYFKPAGEWKLVSIVFDDQLEKIF